MGPAPMIRMVEISVLLGIRSRGLDFGHKKRARVLRVPRAVAPGYPRRAGWSLDQIPHPRNPQKQAINGDFQGNQGVLAGGWPSRPRLRCAPAAAGRTTFTRSLTSYRLGMALSSEVDSGSRQENASKKERFYRLADGCRATKVIRHGLWPILAGARVAEKPARVSFSIISLSP